MSVTWQRALLNNEKSKHEKAIEKAEDEIKQYGGEWQGERIIDLLHDIYGQDSNECLVRLKRYADWIRVGVDIEMLIDNLFPQLHYD